MRDKIIPKETMDKVASRLTKCAALLQVLSTNEAYDITLNLALEAIADLIKSIRGEFQADIAASEDRRRERLDKLDTAFAACDLEGTGCVPQMKLVEYCGKTKTTVQNWVDEHPGYVRENGMIRKLGSADEG